MDIEIIIDATAYQIVQKENKCVWFGIYGTPKQRDCTNIAEAFRAICHYEADNLLSSSAKKTADASHLQHV